MSDSCEKVLSTSSAFMSFVLKSGFVALCYESCKNIFYFWLFGHQRWVFYFDMDIPLCLEKENIQHPRGALAYHGLCSAFSAMLARSICMNSLRKQLPIHRFLSNSLFYYRCSVTIWCGHQWLDCNLFATSISLPRH